MAARRILLITAVSFVFAGLPAFAQDSAVAVPEVQNSKYQFAGTINADAVLVRSGPSDNYYPTARLDKGASVTVVGITFDWLKILPPEGSFSYIAKAYVNKGADDKGTVTRAAINVRAGSAISPMKTAVQTKLNTGDTVDIIGEQDEYYKIKPPAGAYLYVNKQFVTPVRMIGENPQTPSPAPTQNTGESPTPTLGNALANNEPNNSEATTQPTAAPTTQFTIQTSDAEKKFSQLEDQLRSTTNQPLDKQPLADLLAGYQSIVNDPQLPATLQKIAQQRIDNLQQRRQAQEDLSAAQKLDAQLKANQQAWEAKQKKLEQRLAQEQRHLFAAVGTLQTSSVQEDGANLYRLIDPSTGRTLVYVKPSEGSLAQNIGKMVGVRGQIADDPSLGLKIITPTGTEVLDPDELSNVSAQIMPTEPAPTTQP